MSIIPPFELTRQYRLIQEETEAAVLEVLSSGRYIGGEAIADFEQQFASYIGVSNCVACNSGTDALYLALRALGIGVGDEVITSAFSFIATAETISLTGATPVFVDIDLNTFNLKVEAVAAAASSRTKAIVPVHLFGQPVDMTKLTDLARERGFIVIEDCAQATGAEWSAQKVGSIGQIGCFSFYPTKNLGACGDGGAVTTNDAEIAAQIRRLADHGKSDRYIHDAVGINSRLDAVQAVVLQVKLRYLDRWNQQRRKVAARYRELIQPIGVRVPQEPAAARSVWNQYTVLLPDRERVRHQLQQFHIGSTVYYPLPLHLQPVYKSLGYQNGQLPQSEQAAREVLSLPMFPELSFTEQQQVASCLKNCFAAHLS